MEHDYLNKFRQQLAAWINNHLTTRRLPFQKLELCPTVITEQGRLHPDIVLWVNRDSQLAGSMILLPATVTEQTITEAIAISTSLGLGHFTIWDSRTVRLWKVHKGTAEITQEYLLPPANQVEPEDFKETLERLLDNLKITAVSTAPPPKEFSPYYFVNLCMNNLKELSPGLIDSARQAAGQSADDTWLKHAPVEKAWMSLWRILFLLLQKKLPPGLQPNRIEQVFHYAMADIRRQQGYLFWLCKDENEPPLAEAEAIRLHHLGGRMGQLGWPANSEQSSELIELLLFEAARILELENRKSPWPTEDSGLWINFRISDTENCTSIVAPRAYIAGIALKSYIAGSQELTLSPNLQNLPLEYIGNVNANLRYSLSLDRYSHKAQMLLLRKVWPNRRFDLPQNTPLWIYDALYLAGLATEQLNLIFPDNWHNTAGISQLWEILIDKFQLTAISAQKSGAQAISLTKNSQTEQVKVYREDVCFEVSGHVISKAQSTQFWLKSEPEIIHYLLGKQLTTPSLKWAEQTTWGAYLYLHTRLGTYVWNLCTNFGDLPRPDEILEKLISTGIPFPDEMALMDLSHSGSVNMREIPAVDILEQEFSGIFGAYPRPPEENIIEHSSKRGRTRRSQNIFETIEAEVFIDGVPHFPEDYLRRIYKPVLSHYTTGGQLELVEKFFGRILLRTADGSNTLEVTGAPLAEALILASWSGRDQIGLPEDLDVLSDILEQYCFDLRKLWEKLTRECRRTEPQRQASIRMARKIWKNKGLPPEALFERARI